MNTLADMLSSESEIGLLLSEFEVRGLVPDPWEVSAILNALASDIAGLYQLSKADISLARTPAEKRSPSFECIAELDQYSLKVIKNAFEKIRKFPLVVHPVFGPIKLIK